jgi:RHS repeat-associated protein
VKSSAVFKILSAQLSAPNTQRCALSALAVFFFSLNSHDLQAQIGNDNPTGVAGIFNGSVLEYDPYTGNAGPRSTVDISIAGAVIPVALVRTYNSRDGIGIHYGYSGWRHSYEWSIDPSGDLPDRTFPPAAYVVNFPDGRREIFKFVDWDCGGNPYTCYYRVQGYIANVEHSSAGVRERFIQIDPRNNNLLGYLVLPDGSKVEFLATRHPGQQTGYYYYTYQAQAIIDPHGLRTTLTYEQTGLKRLTRVQEPSGRYIDFHYRPQGSQVIDYVQGSDGRSVQYNYGNISPGGTTYLALLSVTYYGQSQWTAHYIYRKPNTPPDGGVPLLLAADEPLYPGIMKRVAYQYQTADNEDGSPPPYGQIYQVRYYAGYVANPNPDPNTGGNGVPVSTLAVTARETRKETRGDNKWRTFTYGNPDSNLRAHLLSCTDFINHIGASQTYDDKMYINSVTDRNGHKTQYTLDPLTGNVTQVQFPAIVTPSPAPSGIISYTYGWAGCQDSNNRDDRNPYFLCTATDEAGHIAYYTRDPNHRLTQIDYPDGGSERFSYDSAHFYQISSHQLTTGGTETFYYDGLHRLQYYSDAYHSNPGNPSLHYLYDSLDRVNEVDDALSHPTNYEYNDRGQLTKTTLTADPSDGQRHAIINTYNQNGDGTVVNKTDELGHVTTYTYDDYRRVKSVKTPRDQASNLYYTTSFYYDANGTGDDYKYTDSNVTWVVLPSSKKTNTHYDDNRRKDYVIVASGLPEAAQTSFEYDPVGNLTKGIAPEQQPGGLFQNTFTKTEYDERNRPWRITDALNHATTIYYDSFGRKKKIHRHNGQDITYDTFDQMNRVTQQSATSAGTTKYRYHPGSGLLYTMQDPRLVALGRDPDPWVGYVYTYLYDLMGRKSVVGYPPDSGQPRSFEAYTYDSAGRLYTFVNRNAKTQTLEYDALNRQKDFYWDDGTTPRVDFTYDVASRLTDINNPNATIHRAYWDDNLPKSETENTTSLGGTSKTVSYDYDTDGNRHSITYPGNAYSFSYDYTGRNQLWKIKSGATALAMYGYNRNGDMTSLSRNPANTGSTYTYDALDLVKRVDHSLNGSHRTFDYDYDSVGNRKWARRDGGNGDVFGYDVNDQVTAVVLGVPHPDSTPVGDQTIFYDGSGNRTRFAAYDSLDQYTVNDLNQYTARIVSTDNPIRPTPTPRPDPTPYPRPTPPGQQLAAYDYTGNLTNGFDGSTYMYDAQNRLLTATFNGVSTFKYDGLNRQVSRIEGGVTTFSVWDGWDLIEEYRGGNNVTARYLNGPNGVIKNLSSNNYYFQDGSSSTSHLTDSNGNLRESYLYDLHGAPAFLDQNGNQLLASAYGVRHLFTGQQWYANIGLYDLRNRFYSPDIGRFLQPDPIGFGGDATNLYRYCGNNPVTRSDSNGTYAVSDPRGWYTYIVNPGWGQYVWTPGYVPGSRGWCAWGAQILSGGFVGGTYYNMPDTGYWYQGASLTPATRVGTVVATGWQNGGYPSLSPDKYRATYGQDSTVNHTGIFLGFDSDGNALILDQYKGKILGVSPYSPDGWYEVYVDKSDGPYGPGTSGGRGDSSEISANEQARINGLARLESMYNSYYGYLPTSPTVNFAGGIAIPGGWHSPAGGPNFGVFTPTGGPISNSIFGPRNWYSGLDPISAFPGIYDYNPIGAMEPSECFVAGTPILMADGSEKTIEDIKVGEVVLAWNEETKKAFSSKVVSALHHEERLETLFDVELEDGRKFTVNNTHPIYTVEDDDFKFTDDLAARFAKGAPITFQDNNERTLKVTSLRMHTQVCKMYNLHVEGQGKNGHTYYANGILVHNFGAGFRRK